jgi:hypothetical protein
MNLKTSKVTQVSIKYFDFLLFVSQMREDGAIRCDMSGPEDIFGGGSKKVMKFSCFVWYSSPMSL